MPVIKIKKGRIRDEILIVAKDDNSSVSGRTFQRLLESNALTSSEIHQSLEHL